MHEPWIHQSATLAEHAADPASTCVLQTTSLAPHAHAHFGGAYLDIQFAEQLAQPRIGQVVVHDEGAIDCELLTVGVDDIVRVRMAAEPLVGFEQDHRVCARKQVCSGETGDPGADDGHRWPPTQRRSVVRTRFHRQASVEGLSRNARFHRVVCQMSVDRSYSVRMQQRQGDGPLVRIGELSRRLGVSVHVLRAWESRYGLLQPTRSTGGFRLYSAADEERIRRMQAHLAEGLSAAEAARTVLRESGSGGVDQAQPAAASTVVDLATALRQALDAFDEPAAQAVLDRLMSEFSLATVLRDVLIPYLAELGDRWHRGTATVAQEHFATNVVRGRLGGLARGWGSGHGPRAVLACPSGELHDLALMVFGIVLNRNGWRIDYLGANTPIEELDNAIDSTHPDLVVLAATQPEIFRSLRIRLLAISRRVPVAIAGAGATLRFANSVQARLLPRDPVTEAEQAPWPQRL